MKWTARFFLLVLFLSFSELYLLIWVSQHSSILLTLAFCVFTGILGGSLVRHQGIKTIFSIQTQISSGQLPTTDIISGLILLIIGVFLLTPGFLTDTLAFFMLIPALRQKVSRILMEKIRKKIKTNQQPQHSKQATIIDLDEDDFHVH